MGWSIKNTELGRIRAIVLERFEMSDVDMAIGDRAIENPRIPQELSFEVWLQKTLHRINLRRQLCPLIAALVEKMEEDDDDAKELQRIVETSRPPPKFLVSEPLPTPAPSPPPKLERIILLGESTAKSEDLVEKSRKALHEHLKQAFKAKKLSILDWADNWNAGRAAGAEAEDTKALFVRVVNTDILRDNLTALTELPEKIGEKLKLQGPLSPSQILIWNCDGAVAEPTSVNGASQANAGGQETEREKIRARLDKEKLLLAEHTIEDLLKIVRSRLRLERWPPVLRLEDPGNNKLIQKKLIDVILSSTREKCDPPYPQVLYLWGTFGVKADTAGRAMAEPKDLINDDASQDGLIIAIHDLNLTLTDDNKRAFWDFQERLAQYDTLLTPIIRAKNIPDNKVVKLAIIMERSLPDGQFPWAWMRDDWTIAGLKKENDTIQFEGDHERRIKEKIDALLGAD
jgi:hypothetical protein